MRKFIFIVVLFLGIAVVALSFGELETILETLHHARPSYVLLAILVQFLWFVTTARMYRSIFRLLGVNETTWNLAHIATAANFINVVAPTGGAGGVALFASEAHRRGHPTGKVTVAAALFLLLDQIAFICVLAVGLAILARSHELGTAEITASLILFALAVGYGSILYIGYRSEKQMGNLLAKITRLINRIAHLFRKQEYLQEARAYEFAHEIAEGFSGLTEKTSSLVRPIAWGILDKTLLMVILIFSFLAFGVPFSISTIIAGFSIAYLFVIVSPTPSGIAIVEGLMPLALNSLGVNWSQAVVVTLAYRAVTFWVPLGVGAWTFRQLHANE